MAETGALNSLLSCIISKPHISFEQSYIFTKLHPQKGLSYIWLV